MEIVLVGIINLCCFLAGAWMGGQGRGEKLQLPDPRKAYRERREKARDEAQQQRLLTILQNIEGYDGTAHGQKDVD